MTVLFQTIFFKVDNKNRHHNAESFYYFCRDLSGTSYLFTDAALIEANDRANKNPEDIPNNLPIHNPSQLLNDRDMFLQTNVDLSVEVDKWKSRFKNLAICFASVVVCAVAFAAFLANR